MRVRRHSASWNNALSLVRPGGTVGYVGVPHDVKDGSPIWKMFDRNVSVRGGVAPARRYLPDLLAEVLDGALDPAPIFTDTVRSADIARRLPGDGRTPGDQGSGQTLNGKPPDWEKTGQKQQGHVSGRHRAASGRQDLGDPAEIRPP